MARSPKRKNRRVSKTSPKTAGKWRRRFRWVLVLSLLFSLPVAVVYGLWLDYRVTSEFEGKRWALPARVYARPLELYQGMRLRPENLEIELQALNYRQESGGSSLALINAAAICSLSHPVLFSIPMVWSRRAPCKYSLAVSELAPCAAPAR